MSDKTSIKTWGVQHCIGFIQKTFGNAEAARCCFRIGVDDKDARAWRNEVYRLTKSSRYDPHIATSPQALDTDCLIIYLAKELAFWKRAHHNVAHTKRTANEWKAKLLAEKNEEIERLEDRIEDLEAGLQPKSSEVE